MFNLNQQRSSNSGIVNKIKAFLFGKSASNTQFAPKSEPEKAPIGVGYSSHFAGHDGEKVRRVKHNRRRADIVHTARMKNYALCKVR